MKSLQIYLFSITLLTSLIGCSTRSGPDTHPYRPMATWEQQHFQTARLDVFPGDVLNYPKKYGDTLVAWTGIIRRVDVRGKGDSRVARYTIEHRYFDWVEDPEREEGAFLLSKRGEGVFATAWTMVSQQDYMYLSQFEVGDMMIAYGYPSVIRNMVVGFYPTVNMRPIKREWYRADLLNYGRPGGLGG